jgi:hypothetical protein
VAVGWLPIYHPYGIGGEGENGKPSIAPLHPTTLLPSGPGEFGKSWSYQLASANLIGLSLFIYDGSGFKI